MLQYPRVTLAVFLLAALSSISCMAKSKTESPKESTPQAVEKIPPAPTKQTPTPPGQPDFRFKCRLTGSGNPAKWPVLRRLQVAGFQAPRDTFAAVVAFDRLVEWVLHSLEIVDRHGLSACDFQSINQPTLATARTVNGLRLSRVVSFSS